MMTGIYFALPILLLGCQLVSSQDEPGAKWMASPHMTAGRASPGYAKYLILHGTAGGSSATGVASWFQSAKSQASTHYVVDQQGVVVQCVREKDTAWANGIMEAGRDPWWTSNPNAITISIEHVKSSTDNSNHLTQAQKEASFKLINNILKRNPHIRRARADANGGITGHYSISPKSRAKCPGPYPWDEMFAAIGGGGTPSPPPPPPGGGGTSCVGTVNAAGGLNVRSQPNTSSSKVASLTNGQTVTISERVNGANVNGNTGWFKIPQGYISAHFVNLQDPKPSWCHK